MNDPIRRLSVVALVMILALMMSSSWIQVLGASRLNEDPRNVRTLYREYGTFRGPIVVEGESVVSSVPVDDPFNFQRTYALGPVYAPVTGYYSIVYGRSGIERTENTLLNGTSDSLFWTRMGNLFSGEQQAGASVELTLQAAVQQAAYDALGDQRGAVVALDPETGAILAMASTPSYDPAVLASHSTSSVNEAYASLLADPNDPLINRSIAETYPPGSTFKLVVTAAALEAGYTPETSVLAPDELALPNSSATIKNYESESCTSDGTDRTTLAEALRISCNTAFAQIGMLLQWGVIERKAEAFGFGTSFEIPLLTAASQLPEDPDAAQTAQSSIGQFDVRATPLQMAMVAAAIANDGELMYPYLVDQVRTSSFSVVEEAEPRVFSSPMTTADANTLTDMMVAVVDSGTGRNARIDGVAVAGKTGTAETGLDTPAHSWFVAFAPADDPQVAVAVLVENGGDVGSGGTGGRVAAPIAKAVMEAALAHAGGQ